MPTNHGRDNDAGQRSVTLSKWVLVGTITVIGMINYAVRTAITAVYPLLRTELGFTDIGLGAIGSFFLWSYALASPFAGHLGDRFSRGRIVLFSLIGWSLVTLASGLVHARWQLLAMRVVLGLVESLFLPAGMALIAEYHSDKTLGTAMGVMNVGLSVGLIGGTGLVGLLADHYGWRPSLLVLGAAGLLFAIPAYFLLPMKKRTVPPENAEVLRPAPGPELSFVEALTQMLRIPSYLVVLSAGALTAIGVWIFLNWLPLYFKETFAMSLAGAGIYGASFLNASAAVNQVVGGVLSDRAARKGPQYRMLLQSGLILCAAPTLLVFVFTKNLVAIVVAIVLYAAFQNAGDTNMSPLTCDLAGGDRFSIAFGTANMVNCLAGGLGIFVAGMLKASLGLRGVFVGIIGFLVFDSLMLFCGYRLFLQRDLEKAALHAKAAAVPSPML